MIITSNTKCNEQKELRYIYTNPVCVPWWQQGDECESCVWRVRVCRTVTQFPPMPVVTHWIHKREVYITAHLSNTLSYICHDYICSTLNLDIYVISCYCTLHYKTLEVVCWINLNLVFFASCIHTFPLWTQTLGCRFSPIHSFKRPFRLQKKVHIVNLRETCII